VVRLFQEDMFRQEHVYEDGFFLQECGGLVCDRHHAWPGRDSIVPARTEIPRFARDDNGFLLNRTGVDTALHWRLLAHDSEFFFDD